jgi:hypothetical protein
MLKSLRKVLKQIGQLAFASPPPVETSLALATTGFFSVTLKTNKTELFKTQFSD